MRYSTTSLGFENQLFGSYSVGSTDDDRLPRSLRYHLLLSLENVTLFDDPGVLGGELAGGDSRLSISDTALQVKVKPDRICPYTC